MRVAYKSTMLVIALAMMSLGTVVISPYAEAQSPSPGQHEKAIPISTMVTQGGQATLQLVPESDGVHGGGAWQVDVAVIPGASALDTDHPVRGPESWVYMTGVWDGNGWIGCFMSADGSPSSTAITSGEGTIPLHRSLCPDGPPPELAYYTDETGMIEERKWESGQISWFFGAYYMSTAYTDGGVVDFLANIIMGALVSGVVATVLVSCNVVCAVGMSLGTAAVVTAADAIYEEFKVGCWKNAIGDHCARTALTTLISAYTIIEGLPYVQSYISGEEEGRDTWDLVEGLLYSQPPTSPLGFGIPYDDGLRAYSLLGTNVLAGQMESKLTAVNQDEFVDNSWYSRPSVYASHPEAIAVVSSDAISDPHTIIASVSTPLEAIDGLVSLGLVVQAQWDWEYAYEPNWDMPVDIIADSALGNPVTDAVAAAAGWGATGTQRFDVTMLQADHNRMDEYPNVDRCDYPYMADEYYFSEIFENIYGSAVPAPIREVVDEHMPPGTVGGLPGDNVRVVPQPIIGREEALLPCGIKSEGDFWNDDSVLWSINKMVGAGSARGIFATVDDKAQAEHKVFFDLIPLATVCHIACDILGGRDGAVYHVNNEGELEVLSGMLRAAMASDSEDLRIMVIQSSLASNITGVTNGLDQWPVIWPSEESWANYVQDWTTQAMIPTSQWSAMQVSELPLPQEPFVVIIKGTDLPV